MNAEQPHNIDRHIQNTEDLKLINPEKIEISDPLISAIERGDIESFDNSLKNSLSILQEKEGSEYDIFRNMQNHQDFLHYLGFKEEYNLIIENSKIKNELVSSILNAVKTKSANTLWKEFLEIREYGKIILFESALDTALDTLKSSGDIEGHVRQASFIGSQYLNLSSTYEKTSKNKYKQTQYWEGRAQNLNVRMNNQELLQNLNTHEQILVDNTVKKIKTGENTLIFKDFKEYITNGDRITFEKIMKSTLRKVC
jgi:hypothetical protein